MPSSLEQRIRTYKGADPRAKTLDLWSKILGWASTPLIAAWLYFGVEYLHENNLWLLFGVALALTVPSVALSAIFVLGFYRYRALIEKKNAA